MWEMCHTVQKSRINEISFPEDKLNTHKVRSQWMAKAFWNWKKNNHQIKEVKKVTNIKNESHVSLQ